MVIHQIAFYVKKESHINGSKGVKSKKPIKERGKSVDEVSDQWQIG